MSNDSDDINNQLKRTPEVSDERLNKVLLKLQELRSLLLANMRTIVVAEPAKEEYIGNSVHPFELKAWRDSLLHRDENKMRERLGFTIEKQKVPGENKDSAENKEKEARKKAVSTLDEFSRKLNEHLPNVNKDVNTISELDLGVSENLAIGINPLEALIIKHKMQKHFDNLAMFGLRQDFADAMEALILFEKSAKDKQQKERDINKPKKPAQKSPEEIRRIKEIKEKPINILKQIMPILRTFLFEKNKRWKKRQQVKPAWTGKPIIDILDVKEEVSSQDLTQRQDKEKTNIPKSRTNEEALKAEAQSIHNINEFVSSLQSLILQLEQNQSQSQSQSQNQLSSLYSDDLNDLIEAYKKESMQFPDFDYILKTEQKEYNEAYDNEDKLEKLHELANNLGKYYRINKEGAQEVTSRFLKELQVIIEHRNQVMFGVADVTTPASTSSREKFERLLRNFLLQDIDVVNHSMHPAAALKQFLANHVPLMEFLENNLDALKPVQTQVLADIDQLNQIKREALLENARERFNKGQGKFLGAEALSNSIIRLCKREKFWSSLDSKRVAELRSQGKLTELFNFMMDRYSNILRWRTLKPLLEPLKEFQKRDNELKQIVDKIEPFDKLLDQKIQLTPAQQKVYEQLNELFIFTLEQLIKDKVAFLREHKFLTYEQEMKIKMLEQEQKFDQLEKYVNEIFGQFKNKMERLNLAGLSEVEEQRRQDELKGINEDSAALLFQGPTREKQQSPLTLREKGQPPKTDPGRPSNQ